MNKQNRNKYIDTENKLVIAKWDGHQGDSLKGKGIKKCRLAATKQ